MIYLHDSFTFARRKIRPTLQWRTWAPRHLKSPATQLFFHWLFLVTIKKISKPDITTGDPLDSRALAHSRAPLFTQLCPHCSHSRAPGEQWARLCVFTLQGCVQAARLCRGSPVITGPLWGKAAGGFLHIGLVMWKAFPYNDVIMKIQPCQNCP